MTWGYCPKRPLTFEEIRRRKMKDDLPWELKIAEIKDAQKAIKEMMSIIDYVQYAKQYKTYFDALVGAGFSEIQALEIVKTHGWIPK